MNDGVVVDLLRSSMGTVALIGAPFMLGALIVGIVISLLQAATQLQEPVITFVPKLITLGLILLLGGPWLLDQISVYTRSSFNSLVKIGKAAGE